MAKYYSLNRSHFSHALYVIRVKRIMDNWKELSLIKKIFVGAAILVLVSFAPELMILVDVGGIELAFGYLLVYYKPLIEWLRSKYQAIIEDLKIAREIFFSSALARPKVFTVNAIYCTVFMLMTGSVFLSFGFFLPALFVSGIYI